MSPLPVYTIKALRAIASDARRRAKAAGWIGSEASLWWSRRLEVRRALKKIRKSFPRRR